jgi:hypothetical protein
MNDFDELPPSKTKMLVPALCISLVLCCAFGGLLVLANGKGDLFPATVPAAVSEKPVARFAAQSFLGRCAENLPAMEHRYKGRTIMIGGSVSKIATDKAGRRYLVFITWESYKEGDEALRCYSESPEFLKYGWQSRVDVTGVFGGMVKGNPLALVSGTLTPGEPSYLVLENCTSVTRPVSWQFEDQEP